MSRSAKQRKAKSKGVALEAVTSRATGFERRQGKAAPQAYRELLRQYRGWTHHCASINATNVASATLRLFVARKGAGSKGGNGQAKHKQYAQQHSHVRKAVSVSSGEYEEVLSHPVLDVLSRPNAAMSAHEFWRLIELWLGLIGNCYIWREPGPLGVTAGLWLIPPIGMRIVPGSTSVVDGYLYSPDGVRKTAYEAGEIIHIRRPNPLDPYFYGFGDAASEPEILYLSGAIDEWELASMRNSARPDGLLESDEAVGPAEIRRLRQDWQRIYSGTTNAGKVAILQGGAKFKAISWNPKDVQTLEGDKRCMKRIASAFGVPMSMLTSEDINRANADAGERQYAKQTLMPRLTNYASQLTEEWVVDYDPRLFLLFDSPVPQERLLDARVAEIYTRSDILTVNEVRAGLKLPAVEWGDMPASARKPAPVVAGPGGQPTPSERPAKSLAAKTMADGVVTRHVTVDVSAKANESPATATKFTAALQAMFAAQERQLLGDAGKGAEEDAAAEAKRIRAKLDSLQAEWEAMAQTVAVPHMQSAMLDGGEAGLARLATMGTATDITWDVTRPEVQAFVDKWTVKLSGSITHESRRRVMDAVGRGLESGANTFEIRNMVREQYTSFSKYRAEMIARTETSRATHGGEIEAWKQSGVVTRKIWSANSDACEFCQSLNGVAVSLEVSYAELGSSVASADPSHPGASLPVEYSAIESPPLHPDCKCYLIPEVSTE